jgi:hypothetical protein
MKPVSTSKDPSRAVSLAWSIYEIMDARCRYFFLINRGVRLIGKVQARDSRNNIALLPQLIFEIEEDWIMNPPKVWCMEDFIKVDIDWHVYNGKRLCWDFSPRWRRIIREIEKHLGINEAITIATQWVVQASTNLTYRHYLASENGISHWPPEWCQWSHDIVAFGECSPMDDRIIKSIINSKGGPTNGRK